MLNKNNYIAIQVCENGKYYAYGIIVPQSHDLISALTIKNILTANICSTKKECREIVTHWNDCYKKNGIYMFDTPQF